MFASSENPTPSTTPQASEFCLNLKVDEYIRTNAVLANFHGSDFQAFVTPPPPQPEGLRDFELGHDSPFGNHRPTSGKNLFLEPTVHLH